MKNQEFARSFCALNHCARRLTYALQTPMRDYFSPRKRGKMLIKWYSQLEVNKASNVVGVVGVAGVSSGCCDSPEKWLELCITKRILRPFAAHAYISAQIVIRGPSEPTKPTKPTTRQTWPTWPTFRASDRPSGHMILHIGQRKSGRKCHAVVLQGG